jgi:hypothetical protein
MANEEQLEAHSKLSKVILYTSVLSGFVAGLSNVPAWRIHVLNCKKDCHQPGRVAGFRSQERCLDLTDSGGTEVINRQEQLSNYSLVAKLSTLFATCFATTGLSGCLVAGYSSGGGRFVWPGSLGLIVIVLLIVFLVRRR